MEGVGPSTVLGARYQARRRLWGAWGAERWTALDTATGRNVVLLCIPASDKRAATVLEAAERVAATDNPRLASILATGTDRQVSFVVEEDFADALPLGLLAQAGGLAAEEVRRLVGEAATALDDAASRGLHHCALTPSAIVRRSQGEVKVIGLGTHAALLERSIDDDAEASRLDAHDLVAITYAGLTGTWPSTSASKTTNIAGMPGARRVVGGVPAPSETAANVAPDLDRLCQQTINENRGPGSPSELIAALGSWSTTEVGDSRSLTPGIARTPAKMAPAPVTVREPAPVPEQAAPSDTDTSNTAPASSPAVTSTPSASSGTTTAAPPEASAPTTAPFPATPTPTTPTPATPDSTHMPPYVAPGLPPPPTPPPGTVTPPMPAQAPKSKGWLARIQEAGERWDGEQWDETAEFDLSSDWVIEDDDIEAPAPLLPREAATPLNKRDSRTALSIIGGGLVVALAFALWGVSRLGSGVDILGPDNPGLSSPRPSTSAAASPAPTSSGGATEAPPTDTPPTDITGTGPVAIRKVKAYDPPPGDKKENNSQLENLTDGDSKTTWQSEGYDTKAVGGLKPGIGFTLDLGSSQPVSEVVVSMETTCEVIAYAGGDPGTSGTKSNSIKKATGESTLKFPANTQARYVTVWFTKLGKADGGRYRAIVSEVKVLD